MQHKPLQNIRILELGGYISGPYGSSLLCALGADLVKVEKPGAGDDFRRGDNDRSPYFIQYNAGKRSLAVDLKDPEGVELVKALVPRFDVLLENMRAGKLDALGLSAEACRALRPDLIYTSVTGFGEGGPLRDRPAYDTIGQAFGGLYTMLGDAGSPQLSGTIFADLVTGLSTATGILAALVGRSTTGSGQHVQTSIMEAVSTITVDAFTQYFENAYANPSRESRHPQAQNFCLPTSSGEFVAVHLSSSQKFWKSLCAAIDRPELFDDSRFHTYRARTASYFELVPLLEEEFVKRSYEEWEQILTRHDVPFAPVHTMDTWRKDPQVDWLELIEPEKDGVSLVRPPWRFDGARPEREPHAPRVGEHTREIAAEVYDAARIEQLLGSGILFADG
jgi:crotonobetainyl-CoA:carnitine CoA-transferase CaiB-like acyl-CoA transferase